MEVIELGDEGGFDAGDKEEGGLAGDGVVGGDEAQAAEEVKGGPELSGDAGYEEAGAASDRRVDVGVGDGDVIEEEFEDWVEVAVGVAGEEVGVHSEDAGHVEAVDGEGGEASLDGEEGGEGGGAEARVLGEGFEGVNSEVVLEVEDLLAEEEAGVLLLLLVLELARV